MAAQQTLFLLLALCAGTLAAKLPDTWPTCKRSDPGFNQCLVNSIQKVLPQLKDGNKQLGMASIAPILVDELDLDLGSGPFSLFLNATNVKLNGVHTSKLLSAQVDMDKHVFDVSIKSALFRIDFTYDIRGKVLVIPVRGDGPAFIEIVKPLTNCKLTFEPFEKKGRTYWNITQFIIDIHPERLNIHFDGLMKGNPAISEQINNFFNNDWELFFRQIRGPAEEGFGEIFKSISHRVFSRVPINEIFRE